MPESTTKPIKQWERERGFMVINLGDHSEDDEITRVEYDELLGERITNGRGVNFDGRTEWLKANDYEVTRENLMNPDLKAK